MADPTAASDAIQLGFDLLKVGGGMGVMWLWNRQLIEQHKQQREDAIDEKKKLQDQVDKLTAFLIELRKE